VSNAIRVRSISFGVALALAGSSAFASQPDPDRVLVQFTPGAKAHVERALQGAGARFHYTFDELNAFAVTVPAQALNGLRNNPNIELIEQDEPRYPMAQTVPYGITMVQAPELVATGANGSGIKVCVIDSGIKADHEDFSGVAMGGFASAGQTWNTDSCGHGTHVAGTIAAANNNVGVIGVSPGAVDLHIVKVFDGAGCGWSYSSSLIDAATKCRDAGAKVINMSLGGGRASRTEESGFNSLYNTSGILSIAAAGNGGNTTKSYPASYASVVSVAAIDSTKALASFSQRNDAVELAAPGVNVLSTYPIDEGSVKVGTTTYSAAAMDGSPALERTAGWVSGGRCTSTGSGAFTGKVVLCERGDISFADKVLNVQNGGGVAAIVYNNVSGAFGGTLNGTATTIPSVSLSQEDGQDMLATGGGKQATVNTIIKTNVNAYAALDGTSMASPHVAGVAAIVWSAKPTATNQQVRDALTSTAEDLGAAGRDNSFGFGLVRAKAAADALTGGSGGSGGGGDTGGNTGSVASTSISFTKNKANFRALGTAVVAPAGATVTGCFSGATSGCGTGTAGSTGSITFQSANFKSGTVTFCVTDVGTTKFTTEHCATGTAQ
jgi:serine protease